MAAGLVGSGPAGARTVPPGDRPAALPPRLAPIQTDFEELMRTTRASRVVAPPSPAPCLADKGRLHGTVPEAAQVVQQWINRTRRTGGRPAMPGVIPMPRARLLARLAESCAGNLTVTRRSARRSSPPRNRCGPA